MQFNPGNASSQAATATITGFSTNGVLSAAAPVLSGNAAGLLPGPVTLINSTAFHDYFHGITLGTTISFVVTLSGPAVDTPNGMATAGSTFAISLYAADGVTPILTNQGAASGAIALIDVNLNGSTTTTAFPTATGGPSVATLTPQVRPTITLNPLPQNVCEGTIASFTAAATSTPTPSVQWQVSIAAGPFADIPGATNTTLSFTALAAQTGNQYRAVFTNVGGTATTNAALLTVNTAPSVTLNPVSQVIANGLPVNLHFGS